MCLAVPGKILSVNSEGVMRMGKVDFAGNVIDICLEWLPEADPGDYVLAHVGTALTMVSEQDAQETLQALRALGEI